MLLEQDAIGVEIFGCTILVISRTHFKDTKKQAHSTEHQKSTMSQMG